MSAVVATECRRTSSGEGRRSPAWLAARVGLAASGDARAWSEIVDEFEGMVWAIARGHRLCPADAADVVQTRWLRFAENLDRLREPARLGAWLATTARRECLRTRRRATRRLAPP
jgi:DNA-directed RNA polymerase specialized sigma24 family protein